MSLVGQKRSVVINGRIFPGVVVSEPETHIVEVPSRLDPSRMVRIPTQRAEVISLRTTNPDLGPVEEYLTQTNENLRFATLRFDSAIGLDVDEDGVLIQLPALAAMTAESMAAFQQRRIDARAEPEVDLDL